jgi:hypothetical protein
MNTPDHKYIFWLHLPRGQNAVVVEVSGEAAKQRAHTFAAPGTEWYKARVSILTRVRRSMTNRVVAMED